LENRIFTVFPGGRTQLPGLCRELLDAQQKNWPALAAACRGLADVQTRSIACPGYEAVVQYNPARAVSSGADVDAESIRRRPCFLCAANLPREQAGILYQNDYLILCNPAPIFDRHFTIVNVRHRPQEIAGTVNQLLDLAADMAPDFVLFYNGPACGASAPDHLHFQAIPAAALPLPSAFIGQSRPVRDGAVKIYRPTALDRAVLLLTGRDKDLLLAQFDRLLEVARRVIPAPGEPMLNALCSYAEHSWRMTIFFRSKHRPDAFFRTDDQRIFISLGAVDMAGMIITPRLNDFQRLDAGQIGRIYREVSLAEDTLEEIIHEL
jgi:hypothetical protein